MSLLPTLYMTKVNTIIKKHDVNAVNCDFQQKKKKKREERRMCLRTGLLVTVIMLLYERAVSRFQMQALRLGF